MKRVCFACLFLVIAATTLLGQSKGLNFASVAAYNSGGNGAFSVAVADLNGDGKPDLVVTNECPVSSCINTSGIVGVLLGNGDGTFRPAVTYNSGGKTTRSVTVADVNGDGRPDLVVANATSDQVGVLLGNGDGTFEPVTTYGSGGHSPLTVVVADVNGDGKPDLLVANAASNGVGVLLGKGDGTFQTAVSYTSSGTDVNSIAVADVNGDGKPDLLMVNVNGTDLTSTMDVLLGNGDGSFQAAVTYSSGGYGALSVAAADVNGDGKPDLLVANCGMNGSCGEGEDGVVGVLLGNGDGTFQTPMSYDAGGYETNSVAVADVNGDGKLDLICANDSDIGTVSILLGKDDGTFQPAITFNSNSFQATGSLATSLAVADINLDGKPDLVVAGGDLTVGVLINTSKQLTTTALVSSLNPSRVGQTMTFTATVMEQPGFYQGPATGTVTFVKNGAVFGTAPLSGGQATLNWTFGSVGTKAITAVYSGAANFTTSTSPVLNEGVGSDPAIITLASNLNPAAVGQSVALTVTVSSTFGVPTGTVTFVKNGATFATATLSAGQATLNYAFGSTGIKTITAVYSGDITFASITSPVFSQTVNKATTATALVSSLNPSIVGQSVILTATVTPQFGGIPTGTVAFMNGTVTMGTVTLSGGRASFSKVFPVTGMKPLSAVYSGDANYTNSTGIATQTVNGTSGMGPFFVTEVHSATDGPSGTQFNSSTLSVNVTGSNTLLIAAWHAEFDGNLPNSWTVRDNGVSGTEIVDTDGYNGGTGNRRFRIYYWVNPASGSNTVTVSNPYTGGNELAVSVLLFNNVSQTTPVGTPVLDISPNARTGESETVPTTTNDLVLHVIADQLIVTGTLGNGETSVSIANDGHHPPTGDASLDISTKPGSAGSATVSSSGWSRFVINGIAIPIHGT